MLFDPNVAGSSSSTSSRSLEFIAVILAGESSATSNSGNTYIEAGGEDDAPEAGSSKDGAKASNGLLPPILQQVEGKPRIDGLLKWIEEAGVSDTVILAPEFQHHGLSSYLRTRKSPAIKDVLPGETVSAASQQPMLRVDLQQWDEDRETECEALRNWADKSPYKRADIIVFPPDFLERFGSRNHLSLPALTTILDRHRLDEPLVTTLLSEKKPVTGKKQKEAEGPPLLFAYDAKSSTLLDIRDLDEFEEDIPIRNSLLEQHPHLSLTTRLELSHIYVCSRHILQTLTSFPGLRFFEEQALRWLCKMQWQKKLASKAKNPDGKPSRKNIPHSQAEALNKSTTTESSKGERAGSTRIACIVHR